MNMFRTSLLAGALAFALVGGAFAQSTGGGGTAGGSNGSANGQAGMNHNGGNATGGSTNGNGANGNGTSGSGANGSAGGNASGAGGATGSAYDGNQAGVRTSQRESDWNAPPGTPTQPAASKGSGDLRNQSGAGTSSGSIKPHKKVHHHHQASGSASGTPAQGTQDSGG